MYGVGDVRFFDLTAPIYDLVMPAADGDDFEPGFSRASGPVERVLDVGGGSGRASLALPVGDPVVVDISRGLLARARDRGLAAVRGDAARLPVADDGVDGAVVVDALHHFPDRAGALREVARVVRPGGVLVVREFDPGHPLGRLLAVGERLIGMDSSFLGPDALAEELAAVGVDATVLDRGFAYTVVGVVPAG